MSARFFTFVGAKGGVGTSTIVAEAAKALKRDEFVTVIDADLTGRRSAGIIFEALRHLDAAHEEQGRIATVRENSVSITELAQDMDSAYTLTAAEVDAAASAIETGIVLVDCPFPLSAPMRPLIARASGFFIVLEPSLLGVAAARTVAAQLEKFGIPAARISAILCSRSSSGPLRGTDVMRALSRPLAAQIPGVDDRGFARAMASLEQILRELPGAAGQLPLGRSDGGRLRDRRAASTGTVEFPQFNAAGAPDKPVDPDRERIKGEIHAALAQNINLLDASKIQGDAAKLSEMRTRISEVAQRIISESSVGGAAESVAFLKEEIVAEALGFGPLEDLMNDADVTEIMVNGPGNVYIERRGMIEKTAKHFANTHQLRLVIERIVAPLGRRVDESSPMVDARLPDGSRVNAIIEPLSLDGPTLTIRRFGKRRLSDEDLLQKNSVNRQMLAFLKACVRSRLNILISGGTGSGKTTFLNILSAYLPSSERIVTIEDAAELRLLQPHVVRLESRPANLEGRGEIAIRDLVRNSLRMRPDRIVIGECRGAEALDMLQAMNTGHDGSLTTIHANTARDALARVETMVMMAGFDLPVRAIREQISSALNIVIQTARLQDGSRKITGVSEVLGMEGDVITMQEVLRFAQHGVDEAGRVLGAFQYTGVQPMALRRFEEYGTEFNMRELSSLPMEASIW